MYEVFEHTADLGIRVAANDLNSLFAEAGRALFSVIVSNPQDVRGDQQLSFEITGQDTEFLLLDWLSELLVVFESRRMLLSDFQVSIDDDGLKASATGETIDTSRHQLEHEVKAITYHGLTVAKTATGWRAEVIVDI
jgi:SHS2 domain-containing protein